MVNDFDFMKKILEVVSPFMHSGFLKFKMMPYEAWKRNVGRSGEGALSLAVAAWRSFSLGVANYMEWVER